MAKEFVTLGAIWFFTVVASHSAAAQETDAIILAEAEALADTTSKPEQHKFIEDLTFQTQQGLPIAASKIYFTDSKFTVSGFGETSFSHYLSDKDRTSGDIELYNTGLYRFVSYLAYKPKPWLVLYGELFAELLQDGFDEYHTEYMIEAFADFLLDDRLNIRVGTHQVHAGFVNNNDEPVMFYSVNRPDVERVIIPSQWIDLGASFYGRINKDFSYCVGVFQGLDAPNYRGSTWIRGGREQELRFNFNSLLFNGKLGYTGINNTEIVINGFFTRGGNNQEIEYMGQRQIVRANTWQLNSYVRHSWRNWTFMALGSYGQMDETHLIYNLTQAPVFGDAFESASGEVLGSEVFGAYLEVGYDLLGRRQTKENKEVRERMFLNPKEFKLPVFVRLERLNTHAAIDERLRDVQRLQNDLRCITVGVNFNTSKHMVVKANYQFRNNLAPKGSALLEGDRFETGIGFIF